MTAVRHSPKLELLESLCAVQLYRLQYSCTFAVYMWAACLAVFVRQPQKSVAIHCYHFVADRNS